MPTATTLLAGLTHEPTNAEIEDAGAMLARIEAHRQRAQALREACADYDTYERAFGQEAPPRTRGGR